MKTIKTYFFDAKYISTAFISGTGILKKFWLQLLLQPSKDALCEKN